MKSKKLRQLFALALASVMCLTACGNKEVTPSSESSKASGSAASSEEKEPEVKNYWDMLDEVSDISELPDWTGKKLEINIWVAASTQYDLGSISPNNVVWKEFERVTGVVINDDESFDNGGEGIDAKLPKLVTTKDFPTLVFGWDLEKQMKDLWDNGYLADLTEYFEDGTMKHYEHWFPTEEMSALWDRCSDENGSIYLLPTTNDLKYNELSGYYPEEIDVEYYNTYKKLPYSKGNQIWYNSFYVRDDILKALYPEAHTWKELREIYAENGRFTEEEIFDLPLETTEDMMNLIYDIQELLEEGDYVGLDGKPVEVLCGPSTEHANDRWMKWLPSTMGVFPNIDYYAVAEKTEDGKMDMVRAIDSEPYVAWMKTVNKMVNDGIFSKDSMVDNMATWKEKVINGRYALLAGYNGHDNRPYDEDGFNYRPVWIKADLRENYHSFDGMGALYAWGIFKDAVPEGQMDQLMHFIDLLNSEVGLKNMYWGPATAGLFTEDAEGNRTYKDAELEAAMVSMVQSELPYEYGLDNGSMQKRPLCVIPSGGRTYYSPEYLALGSKDPNPEMAIRWYNPGVIRGESYGENATKVLADNLMGSLGASIEGIAQFSQAGSGFENQLKRVLVTETEKEFETQLEILRQYADDNGFTKETLEEYEDLFIETNYDYLKDQGLVD